MTTYVEALLTIKQTKMPIPLVILHLRNGILLGQTCDGCRHLRDFWHAGKDDATVRDLLCAAGGGNVYWSRDWTACGKFVARDDFQRQIPLPTDREESVTLPLPVAVG